MRQTISEYTKKQMNAAIEQRKLEIEVHNSPLSDANAHFAKHLHRMAEHVDYMLKNGHSF